MSANKNEDLLVIDHQLMQISDENIDDTNSELPNVGGVGFCIIR